MNQQTLLPTLLILVGFTIHGCGNGSPNSSSTNTPAKTGVFLDSPVSGLGYTSISYSGNTDAQGQFSYASGETVSFHIGSWTLGSNDAAPYVTPLDLTASGELQDGAINRARLLQSLDSDGDPSNGIQLNIPAGTEPTGTLDFDVPSADFETNPEVLAFIGAATNTSTLVTRQASIDHLQDTINNVINLTGNWERIIVNTSNTCGYPLVTRVDNWRIAQTGGNVDIYDDENTLIYAGTLSLSGTSLYPTGRFNYDGGGYEDYEQIMTFSINGNFFSGSGEWDEYDVADNLICSGVFINTARKL